MGESFQKLAVGKRKCQATSSGREQAEEVGHEAVFRKDGRENGLVTVDNPAVETERLIISRKDHHHAAVKVQAGQEVEIFVQAFFAPGEGTG